MFREPIAMSKVYVAGSIQDRSDSRVPRAQPLAATPVGCLAQLTRAS
jgi:hypothetical protein